MVATVAAIVDIDTFPFPVCGGLPEYATVRQGHGAGVAVGALNVVGGAVDVWVDIGLCAFRAMPHVIVDRL